MEAHLHLQTWRRGQLSSLRGALLLGHVRARTRRCGLHLFRLRGAMSCHGRRGSFSCAEKVAVAEGADGACDGEGGPDDGYLMLIMKRVALVMAHMMEDIMKLNMKLMLMMLMLARGR